MDKIDLENKKVLLQRRSPNKKQDPNKLALCAGHVVENETITEALFKEAKEELGLDLNNFQIHDFITIKRIEPSNYCFSHHFYLSAKIPLDEFEIQKEKLSEVIYLDYLKLNDLVMNNSDRVVFKWNDEYKNYLQN